MSKKERAKPIRDYIDVNDLKEKIGVRTYKPKMGVMFRALIELSKSDSQVGQLIKSQLDELFKKFRKKKKKKRTKEQIKNNVKQ